MAFLLPWFFASPAHAGPPWSSHDEDYGPEDDKMLFFSIGGGGSLPVSTGSWRDAVESGVAVAVRAGYGLGDREQAIYLAAGLEYTSLRDREQPRMESVDLRRTRFLAGLRYEHQLRERLLLTVRADLGYEQLVDGGSSAVQVPTLRRPSKSGGPTFELGSGLWFAMNKNFLLGAELGLPTSIHKAADGSDEYNLGTTDVSLIFGVLYRLERPGK